MTKSERKLSEMLNGYDNLESVAGGSTSSGVGATLGNVRGNPLFKAQFDLNVKIVYRKNGNVDTPASLDSSLKQQLPVFIFGNSDWAGGYAKGYQLLPASSAWTFERITSYGFDGTVIAPSVVVAGNVKKGDLVFQYAKGIGSDNYEANVIISCEQVAYTTLLDSISSDLFKLNSIRYSVNSGSESQFTNNISVIKQSLFGKVANDFVSPQSFQNSMDFQKNIIDIPLSIGIDKNIVLGTYLNYDVPSFRWTCFVAATQKLTAQASI